MEGSVPHASSRKRCADLAGSVPLGQISNHTAAKDLITIQQALLRATPGRAGRLAGLLGPILPVRARMAGDLTAHHRGTTPNQVSDTRLGQAHIHPRHDRRAIPGTKHPTTPHDQPPNNITTTRKLLTPYDTAEFSIELRMLPYRLYTLRIQGNRSAASVAISRPAAIHPPTGTAAAASAWIHFLSMKPRIEIIKPATVLVIEASSPIIVETNDAALSSNVVPPASAAINALAASEPFPVHSDRAGSISESFWPTAMRASPISDHAVWAQWIIRQSPPTYFAMTSLIKEVPVTCSINQSTLPRIIPALQRISLMSALGFSGSLR